MFNNQAAIAFTRMTPNLKNACSGRFSDWLEVLLTSKCNGNCSWCVEKNGFHPSKKVSWQELSKSILNTGKRNIILLGGEPTIYPDLSPLVHSLTNCVNNRLVYITTNGSKLTPDFIRTINTITGINISIHHYDLKKNFEITNIKLDYNNLLESVKTLKKYGIKVRLNCNLIKNHIDTKAKIFDYIDFVKSLGINYVRFAELKYDKESFIDLSELFGNAYGLNKNPFEEGCNCDAMINDVNVNFRQMCGFQTSCRPRPDNPEFCEKHKTVLYYDGKLYNGWQTKKWNKTQIKKLLDQVKNNTVSIEDALLNFA